MLRRTPFFRACNHSFLAALADELTTHVFMPDDVVFYKGDASTDLYFVLSGTFLVREKNCKQKYCPALDSKFCGWWLNAVGQCIL